MRRGRGRARWLVGALGAVVGASLMSGCGDRPATEHVALEGDMSSLREDFVADAGKVRAIFLASPT